MAGTVYPFFQADSDFHWLVTGPPFMIAAKMAEIYAERATTTARGAAWAGQTERVPVTVSARGKADIGALPLTGIHRALSGWLWTLA
jgi:hypothetical protein